ncbi:hypothetical protein CsSME_00002791 [Camellia sinensis var. sinensis]
MLLSQIWLRMMFHMIENKVENMKYELEVKGSYEDMEGYTQGYAPSFLAQKAKLCSSDWLDYINALAPSALVPSPDMEAPIPPPLLNPCWTERLRLALSVDKVFSPYKPPPFPTPAERKQAQFLFAAFSHLRFNVLEDDVPLKNLRWACDILTRGHVLNPLAQAELHMFLDQLSLLLH